MHLPKKITPPNNGNPSKINVPIQKLNHNLFCTVRKDITKVRQRNNWELPQTDVTSKVKEEFGFQDAWTIAGCPGTVKTCRFDTHIDYIFCNQALLSTYSIESVQHVEDTASDHNMVIATFKTL